MPLIALAFLAFLVFALMGGCGDGDSNPTPEYSTSTNITENEDGSTTHRSVDNYGGDFSCTFNKDGSSDCSGKP